MSANTAEFIGPATLFANAAEFAVGSSEETAAAASYATRPPWVRLLAGESGDITVDGLMKWAGMNYDEAFEIEAIAKRVGDAPRGADASKLFGAIVAALMKKEGGPYEATWLVARARYPELYKGMLS